MFSSTSSASPHSGGAESGAVPAGGGVDALSLMLREFRDAFPAERIRLAVIWGIRPNGPDAAALGVPATDADATDESPKTPL